MLKLKRSLRLPSLRISRSVVAFGPVQSEDDELLQAIQEDAERREDTWQLTPVPDTVELESYWNNVVDDIRADPTWQSMHAD